MDLRELYQDVILDHHRKPRNRREMPEASAQASGHNPLCGDRVAVFVKMDGDVLQDVSFVGTGCAISQASASMMTDCLKGHTRARSRVASAFQQLVTDEHAAMPKATPRREARGLCRRRDSHRGEVCFARVAGSAPRSKAQRTVSTSSRF